MRATRESARTMRDKYVCVEQQNDESVGYKRLGGSLSKDYSRTGLTRQTSGWATYTGSRFYCSPDVESRQHRRRHDAEQPGRNDTTSSPTYTVYESPSRHRTEPMDNDTPTKCGGNGLAVCESKKSSKQTGSASSSPTCAQSGSMPQGWESDGSQERSKTPSYYGTEASKTEESRGRSHEKEKCILLAARSIRLDCCQTSVGIVSGEQPAEHTIFHFLVHDQCKPESQSTR